jgi:hypothetical protein
MNNKIRKILITLIFLMLRIVGFPQTFPGMTFGNDFYSSKAQSISKYSDNEIFITGTYRPEFKESENVFILKIDKNGMLHFFHNYGRELQDRATNITVLKDKSLLVTGESWGGFNSSAGRENVFFLKTDFSGFPKNEKSYFNYHHDTGFKTLELSDGNVMITGYTKSFEDKKGNIYLIKTKQTGEKIWENNFNEGGNDFGFDIIETQNQEILILGTSGGFYDLMEDAWKTHDTDILLIKTDKNGNEILRKKIGTDKHDFGRKIIKNPEGGYFLIGSTQSYGAGSFDVFLVKIDENLNVISYKTYGNEYFNYGNSICISEDKKNLFIAGTTYSPENSTDMFVIKTDLNGDTIWTRKTGGLKEENANDIITLNDGSCIVAGETFSYTNNNISNIYLVKYGTDGEYLFDNIEPLFLVNFYPNPVSETANIQILSNKTFQSALIEIFDLNGKLIKSYNSNTFSYSFPVNNFERGMYLYKITIDNYYDLSGKFIVY